MVLGLNKRKLGQHEFSTSILTRYLIDVDNHVSEEYLLNTMNRTLHDS